MALSPYSALKTAIADWLERADLTTRIPDFVTSAEAHLNADGRIRVREAEAIVDILPDGEGIATLPPDFLAPRFVGAVSNPTGAMTQISVNAGAERYPNLTASAYPGEFVLVGDKIYTYPASSSVIRIVYFPRLKLTDDGSTNWLLTKYPGAYLYGSLAQAALYIHDDARVQSWSGMYEDHLNKIASTDMARYVQAGGTISGPTP